MVDSADYSPIAQKSKRPIMLTGLCRLDFLKSTARLYSTPATGASYIGVLVGVGVKVGVAVAVGVGVLVGIATRVSCAFWRNRFSVSALWHCHILPVS